MQAFINGHDQNTGRVKQMANRYIEGKIDEYSSKQVWSSIGEQYPEGLTRGVIQVHEQWSRQGQTESKQQDERAIQGRL